MKKQPASQIYLESLKQFYVLDDVVINIVQNEVLNKNNKLTRYKVLTIDDITHDDLLLVTADLFYKSIEYITDALKIKKPIKFCFLVDYKDGDHPLAMSYDLEEFGLIICNCTFIKVINLISMRLHCTPTHIMPLTGADGILFYPHQGIARQNAIWEFFNSDLTPANLDFTLFAQNAADVSMMFVIFHEIGHIVNGHLSSKLYQSGDVLTKRCLEMDADCFALQHSFNLIFGNIGTNYPFAKNIKNEKDALYRIVFSFLIVQLIFQINEFGYEKSYYERDHPSAIIRLQDAFDWLVTYIEKTIKVFGRELDFDDKQLMQVTWEAFEGTLHEWGISPIGEAEFEETSTILPVHRKDTSNRWAKIYPDLVKHKYGNHKLAEPKLQEAS